MKRRFAGAAFGVIFSIFCGFISLLSTGGGHGSYMWISLFVIPELCGIYFAVMGFLGAVLPFAGLLEYYFRSTQSFPA
jgi:hypothetical protein